MDTKSNGNGNGNGNGVGSSASGKKTVFTLTKNQKELFKKGEWNKAPGFTPANPIFTCTRNKVTHTLQRMPNNKLVWHVTPRFSPSIEPVGTLTEILRSSVIALTLGDYQATPIRPD